MGEIGRFDSLLQSVREIVNGEHPRNDKLKAICVLLEEQISYYNWVGYYLTDPEQERELMLGPFVGEPTEHTRIAFGQGICGQAAATEQTFIIQDVSQETNYLSCSPEVKSEIVIPIMKGTQVVGELDIDSHELAPFSKADREFLEQVCDIAATLF